MQLLHEINFPYLPLITAAALSGCLTSRQAGFFYRGVSTASNLAIDSTCMSRYSYMDCVLPTLEITSQYILISFRKLIKFFLWSILTLSTGLEPITRMPIERISGWQQAKFCQMILSCGDQEIQIVTLLVSYLCQQISI